MEKAHGPSRRACWRNSGLICERVFVRTLRPKRRVPLALASGAAVFASARQHGGVRAGQKVLSGAQSAVLAWLGFYGGACASSPNSTIGFLQQGQCGRVGALADSGSGGFQSNSAAMRSNFALAAGANQPK